MDKIVRQTMNIWPSKDFIIIRYDTYMLFFKKIDFIKKKWRF